MTDHQLPTEIISARLFLRSWRAGDGPILKQIIDANLDHLQRWMPWAMNEPSPPEVIAERVLKFAEAFSVGKEWLYAIFARDSENLLGGCGLHPRVDPGGLEIGYWIAATYTRQGFATEAASALTRAAFELSHIDYVEIKCDPQNVASAGVPKRLGYRLVNILRDDMVTPTGEPRDTMVWRMTRVDFTR